VSYRDDLPFLTASEQARLLRRGELSAVELVDVYLDRIQGLDGPLNS
jgi:Asp-tRNA(Asn)/Glu-tRNA(Gln) amidotransferase A subunit family amidase